MKIITEPEVFLIGRQRIDEQEIERFLSQNRLSEEWEHSSIPAETISEFGGRICYMSFDNPRPGGTKAYMENIKEHGHGSVLEHAVWNIAITNVSRSLSHELVRHRAGFGYSQLSQRYVDESVAEYVIPKVIAEDAELRAIWYKAMETVHDAYVALSTRLREKLERGFAEGGRIPVSMRTELRKNARQAARSVLPNATETKLLVTANARALRHFLEQRGSYHAEDEIRVLAVKLLRLLKIESPEIFGDYTEKQIGDKIVIDTKFKKV